MKLYSVTISDIETKQGRTYLFKSGDAVLTKEITDSDADNIFNALMFGVGGLQDCNTNAVIEFGLNGFDYKLTVSHNEKGMARKTLKQLTEKGFETVAREKSVVSFLETEADCVLSKVVKNTFIDVVKFKKFVKDGDLSVFDDIKGLLSVIDQADKSFLQNQQMTEDAITKVFKLAQTELPSVTKEDIDRTNFQIREKQKSAALLASQIEQSTSTIKSNAMSTGIINDKATTEAQYQQLVKRQQYIQDLQKQVEAYEETRDILPQAKIISALKAEIQTATTQMEELREEYEWQIAEFDSITKQLEEKQVLSDNLIAQKSRLTFAIEEQARLKKLEAINTELNSSLTQLSSQADKLTTKKVNLKNRLEGIEHTINDIRDNVKEFAVPDFTIGDIVENVRTDAKIAEISAEVDRIQTELAFKESDISDKEMAISGQARLLTNLMNLDSTVSPLKAKDSIIRVIDSKINKLLLINDSLKQKKTNFTRSLEDLSFKQLKIEQSSETLNTMLNRKQFAKEEEFKRQVLLAGARQDSMVEALPAELTDPEIEELKGDIADRTLTKNDIIVKTATLKGALEEIERHLAINNAEIESLRTEKANINRKYLELVAQNRNENTQQYLKSLEANNSTKYLMDIQEEVVKNDTELRSLKKDTEKLQGRLNELLGRLKYLSEATANRDSTQNLEYLSQTNDQIKHELSDIGDRLSMCYTEHKKLSDELEEINYTDFRIQELIMETMQKIKANDREIVEGRERINLIAGGDLTEKLLETENELDEIVGERNSLTFSKEELDKKVFDSKVKLLQLEWIIKEKTDSLNDQLKAVNIVLTDNGTDKNALDVVNGMTEERAVAAREEIKLFFNDKNRLEERLSLLQNILDILPKQQKVASDTTVAKQQTALVTLNKDIAELEEKLDYLMTVYINSNSARLKLVQATHELETLNRIKSVVNQTQIAQVILQDKIANIVKQANAYLQTMLKNKFNIVYSNNELLIGDNKNNLVELAAMENTERLILFTALCLAQPSSNNIKGNWILPDPKLICNHEKYYAALATLKEIVLPTCKM